MCFREFQRALEEDRPLSRKDLSVSTGFTEEGCKVVLRVFREKGWIEVVTPARRGCDVRYQLVAGVTYPGDQRGKSEKARDVQRKGIAKIAEKRRDPFGLDESFAMLPA